MLARNISRIIWGIFGALICLMFIVFAVEHGKKHGIPSLRLEPEYDGHVLSYWLDDSFRYYGAERLVNSDASAAVHSIGTNALPFLMHWLQMPMHSSQDPGLQSRALLGFEILGPEAKPAIPDLIKIIGRFSNWPAMALSYIGPDAVPPLIEMLKTNRTADSPGNRRRGIPPQEDREYAILTLSMLGTNAEAALPVLMQCYGDEAKRSRADVASAIARIGRNQPAVIVPALIYLLANSNGFGQLEAAEALGSLGNKAESAVPALLLAGQSKDAQLQIAAAVATKKIAPPTPDALAPLILNLGNRETYVREQALWGLEKLGTNGIDAKSALLERARLERVAHIRVRAINCLKTLVPSEEQMLPLIKECLTNENESVACAVVGGLISLAERSQDRYLELLILAKKHWNSGVRNTAETGVYDIMRKRPEMFVGCLSNSQVEVYLPALQFLHGMGQDALVIDRREPAPSTNFDVYVIREISDRYKKLLENAVPIVVERLHDPNPEVRKAATNVLLELNPKAAKQAGVVVVPPYSFYAK